jgi:hypothetical protein
MPYSLRSRKTKAEPAQESQNPTVARPKTAKAKVAKKTTPPAATSSSPSKSSSKSKPLVRPSLPISDAKERVIKQLSKVGAIKPSELKKQKQGNQWANVAHHRKVIQSAIKSIDVRRESIPHVSAKALNKAILSQVAKLAAQSTPSVVKSKVAQAPIKLAVTTEILKRAVIADIKRRRVPSPRAKSPLKGR